jgi:hypothetical protein
MNIVFKDATSIFLFLILRQRHYQQDGLFNRTNIFLNLTYLKLGRILNERQID